MSLEDDLMRLFGSDRVAGMVASLGLPEDQPIDARILSNSIESAQKRLEGMHFQSRKNVLMYDDVMNQQRTVIYAQRREVLDGLDLKEKILKMISDSIRSHVYGCFVGDEPEQWNFDILPQTFPTICRKEDFDFGIEALNLLDKDELSEKLIERANALYEEKEKMFTPDIMRAIERKVLLDNVDEKWMEHIDAMDDLKDGVGLRAYGQQDPLVAYKNLGGEMFDEMVTSICDDTANFMLRVFPKKEGNDSLTKRNSTVRITGEGKANDNFKQAMNAGGDDSIAKTPIRKAEKVGRNDPCPCGSGKKYKKCCGANDNSED